MTTGTILWAGKRLTDEEELSTRRLVSLLHRVGDDDSAVVFERFLPEHDERWTPDELEMGAHVGPWAQFDGAEIEAQSDTGLDADAA
jgi:hypothetical protein